MEIGFDVYRDYHRNLYHGEYIHHDLGNFLEEVLVILQADNHHEHGLGVHTHQNGRLVQPVRHIDQHLNFVPDRADHHDRKRLLLDNLGIEIVVLHLPPVHCECSFVVLKSRDLEHDQSCIDLIWQSTHAFFVLSLPLLARVQELRDRRRWCGTGQIRMLALLTLGQSCHICEIRGRGLVLSPSRLGDCLFEQVRFLSCEKPLYLLTNK